MGNLRKSLWPMRVCIVCPFLQWGSPSSDVVWLSSFEANILEYSQCLDIEMNNYDIKWYKHVSQDSNQVFHMSTPFNVFYQQQTITDDIWGRVFPERSVWYGWTLSISIMLNQKSTCTVLHFPRNQVKIRPNWPITVFMFSETKLCTLSASYFFSTFPVSWSELPGWDGSSKLLWSGTSQKTNWEFGALDDCWWFQPMREKYKSKEIILLGLTKYIQIYN